MNYFEENRTPRDRTCGELFYKENGAENKPCTVRQSPKNTGCSCRGKIPAPSLVMSYVPLQTWENLLECDEALENGTLFADLVFPFYPTPCNSGCTRREQR